MLKKLQRQFMRIATMALCTIVFVQLFAVNLMNVYQTDAQAKNILYLISENGGIFPNSIEEDINYLTSLLNPFQKVHITIETPYSTRYFVVKLKGNIVTDISTQNIAAAFKRNNRCKTLVFKGKRFGFNLIEFKTGGVTIGY